MVPCSLTVFTIHRREQIVVRHCAGVDGGEHGDAQLAACAVPPMSKDDFVLTRLVGQQTN